MDPFSNSQYQEPISALCGIGLLSRPFTSIGCLLFDLRDFAHTRTRRRIRHLSGQPLHEEEIEKCPNNPRHNNDVASLFQPFTRQYFIHPGCFIVASTSLDHRRSSGCPIAGFGFGSEVPSRPVETTGTWICATVAQYRCLGIFVASFSVIAPPPNSLASTGQQSCPMSHVADVADRTAAHAASSVPGSETQSAFSFRTVCRS